VKVQFQKKWYTLLQMVHPQSLHYAAYSRIPGRHSTQTLLPKIMGCTNVVCRAFGYSIKWRDYWDLRYRLESEDEAS
jgi:hypothetical protein